MEAVKGNVDWRSIMTLQDWGCILMPLAITVLLGMGSLRLSSDLKSQQRVGTWTVFWLLLSGAIHIFIELAFVFVRDDVFIKPGLDLYAAADFRYGSPMEAGTAAMEAITGIIEGPLCFLAAYGFVHRSKWYHPVQLILTTMQIYGLVWFCAHCYFSEEQHFSSNPFLFWVIAFGMNAPWAVFPPILWLKSFKATCQVEEFRRKKM